MKAHMTPHEIFVDLGGHEYHPSNIMIHFSTLENNALHSHNIWVSGLGVVAHVFTKTRNVHVVARSIPIEVFLLIGFGVEQLFEKNRPDLIPDERFENVSFVPNKLTGA